MKPTHLPSGLILKLQLLKLPEFAAFQVSQAFNRLFNQVQGQLRNLHGNPHTSQVSNLLQFQVHDLACSLLIYPQYIQVANRVSSRHANHRQNHPVGRRPNQVCNPQLSHFANQLRVLPVSQVHSLPHSQFNVQLASLVLNQLLPQRAK
jgi:hypothetical protein